MFQFIIGDGVIRTKDVLAFAVFIVACPVFVKEFIESFSGQNGVITKIVTLAYQQDSVSLL
jgi:hypothetical protein